MITKFLSQWPGWQQAQRAMNTVQQDFSRKRKKYAFWVQNINSGNKLAVHSRTCVKNREIQYDKTKK